MSTLGVIVVGFLLIRNDQSRDVLSGIGEALLLLDRVRQSLSSGSGTLLNPGTGFSTFDSAYAWYGFKAYVAFWASAVLLAATLALVAYVAGASKALAVAAGEEMKSTVWHSAQIIVLATLWVIYLALSWQMRSSPGMLGLPGILLVFVSGPWISLLWVRAKIAAPWRLAISAVISAILTILLFYMIIPGRNNLILAASALIPSLAIVAMAALRPHLPTMYQAQVKVLLFFALVLSAVVFTPWPQSAIWTIGSAAIVLIWLAWAAVILAVVVVGLRGLRQTGVGIDPTMPLVLVALWLFTGEERLGRESLQPESPPQPGSAAILDAPDRLGTGGEEEKIVAIPSPRLAIHADGGGVRAALFTAEVLAIADDVTCGDFGEHVAAASGVSGGSVGIATWAVIRQEYKDIQGQKAWGVCKKYRSNPGNPIEPNVQDPQHFPISTRVYGILAQDHLSVTLATMLTRDLWPWGDAKRGQALLDSLQAAARDVLQQYDGRESRQAFAIQLRNINAGLARKPILMFTATDADSGKRIVFLNSEPASSNIIKDIRVAKDVQVGVAALHSARFPLISPAGRVAIGDDERRAVDGGYFDNSGAATLIEIFSKALHEKIKVVRINGNASDGDDPACGAFHKALISKSLFFRIPPRWTVNPGSDTSSWSGLKALTASRTALAEETAASLKSVHLQLQYYPGFDRSCEGKVLSNDFKKDSPPPCVENNIRVCWGGLSQPRAPLGWYLSRAAADGIYRSATVEALELLRSMAQPSVP